MDTREIALDALIDITGKKLFSNVVLEKSFKKYDLDSRDRAFVTRLVEGTIERMIYLDYVINGVSKTATVDMSPAILNILRLGAYQIIFMDKVPDSAACNEAVEMAKRRKYRSLSGFVNGVMRSIARMDEVQLPNRKKNPAGYISTKYSFPKWMVKKLLKTYDKDEVERILGAMLSDKPLCVRTNTLKVSSDKFQQFLIQSGYDVSVNPFASDSFIINNPEGLIGSQMFEKGYFYIQDTSSILGVSSAGLEPGMRVLDVCAAPGGKSICAALLMNGEGEIVSRDLSEKKVDKIRENIHRLGITNITPQVQDASQLVATDIGQYDVVIADLPCSGLGVMGRKTDIKYHISQEGIDELSELQRQILSVVSQYVRPGGTLIYSTCTITQEENWDNARWIANNLPFKMEEARQLLPGDEIYYDGFFISRFTRLGD